MMYFGNYPDDYRDLPPEELRTAPSCRQGQGRERQLRGERGLQGRPRRHAPHRQHRLGHQRRRPLGADDEILQVVRAGRKTSAATWRTPTSTASSSMPWHWRPQRTEHGLRRHRPAPRSGAFRLPGEGRLRWTSLAHATLDFDEIFASVGVLGHSFSYRLHDLNGQNRPRMHGFLAPAGHDDSGGTLLSPSDRLRRALTAAVGHDFPDDAVFVCPAERQGVQKTSRRAVNSRRGHARTREPAACPRSKTTSLVRLRACALSGKMTEGAKWNPAGPLK